MLLHKYDTDAVGSCQKSCSKEPNQRYLKENGSVADNRSKCGNVADRKLQNELQQRHPYIYGASEFVGAMTTPMHLVKDTTFANKAFNAFTDTLNASAGYANNWNDFATNLAVNGFANAAGLPIDAIPFTRAVGRPLVKFGKKFIKQGINSSADKAKNLFYKKDDEDEEYYY